MAEWKLRQLGEEERNSYRSGGWWTGETLGQRMAAQLAAHGDRPFVVHSTSRPWRGTFADVLDLSRRVATGLAARGVGPGDVVSFQTPNWVEGAVTFYAAALRGAVVAPIVHIYGARELGYILKESEPRVHVTATSFGHLDYLANLQEVRGTSNIDVVVIGGDAPRGSSLFEDLVEHPPIESPIDTDPEAPALIGWTSGTTANPKGVVHSHQSVLAEVMQLGATAAPDERPTLLANPISHAIGMLGALLIPIDRGRPVHLLDQFDPSVVLSLMIAEDLNAGGGAPYFLTSLLDHPGFTDEHLARISQFGMGGAPVPRVVANRATSLGITVYRMYGSTEHPSITGCRFDAPLQKRLATDGRPLDGNEIRLVDAEGDDVGIGVPGEVLSRGPELFLGYTDPESTAAAFDDGGWYHTGDVAVMDEDGFICITDRKSDVIIRGGENIGAAEVEELLAQLSGVAEVAVVAAPDERMGEHAAALFRMLPDHAAPSMDEVRTHLEREGLARQKWPEELVEVKEFPRTTSGKVQKFVLRGQFRERSPAYEAR